MQDDFLKGLNSLKLSDTYMGQLTIPSLVQIKGCRQTYIVNWTLKNIFQWNFISNSEIFIQENALEHGDHLVSASMFQNGISGIWVCLVIYINTSIAGKLYIHSLVQDCSISSALAMEILQSCTKPSIYSYQNIP